VVGQRPQLLSGLGRGTWSEVASARARVLVLPLGALEQHGPHLPLDTDTCIAVALAARLREHRPDACIAPALPFGASGEHAAFPGTLSLGQWALELAIVELVRGADWFDAVLLVCWHGGNADPLAGAIRTLHGDGRSAAAWTATERMADAHAGRTETSLMLALDPAAVRIEAAEAGDKRPLEVLLPALQRDGVRAVSPNGVLGDPRGACAEEGEWLLAQLTDSLVQAYDALDV
jgi:mycofactocin precursor peptide peptidase